MAMQRRVTEAIYRKNLQDNVAKEEAAKKFFVGQQQIEMIGRTVEAEERIEQKRLTRRLAKEQQERLMNHSIMRAREIKEQRERQAEQEEKLALEMKKIKVEKLRDEKMRQQIRDGSEEIRELESKLRAAYMNQERAAQVAEKKVLQLEMMKRDSEIEKVIKSEHKRAQIAAENQEAERHEEMLRYKIDLEKQLEDEEHKKQEAYEEFLKEKLMIDEIVRKIYEEDEREEQLRIEKMNATRQYIEEFKRMREEWKIAEKERYEEENRRIKKFAESQRLREADWMNRVQEKNDAKSAMIEALGEKLAADRQVREERENIQLELLLEEQREADIQKEQDEREKVLRTRIDLQEDHQRQMKFKQMRQEAEKRDDENFRDMMLAKFAEDDRIEQMNDQKRRMKQLEHKRAVQALLEDRKKRFAKDREEEMKSYQEQQEMEKIRRRIVEEERKKLLKEHATKLLGYLPKGVLESEKDLELFDEHFQKEYQSRRRDPFDSSFE